MNHHLSRIALGTALLAGAITAGTYAWQDASQKPAAKGQQPPAHQQQEIPDLIGALKKAEGCLGVEVGQMMSGKNVIFSWFEDKDSVLKWYYSEPHQQSMDMFFNERAPDFKPLDGVPDDAGPLLVIASITMAQEGQYEETSLPVSQIAIEIYQPVTGGLFLGGRFAPDGVKVDDMQDYTPKPADKPSKPAPQSKSMD